MSYKILPTKEFEKDFNKLDKDLREKIKKKINKVALNPDRYKHLRYDLNDSCRLWIDKLRIVYSYDVPKKELYLEKIILGHKY